MWKDPVREAKASSASAWGDNRLLARQLLMKAKLYRMFALFFAVTGVVVFISLFLSHIEGSFFDALRDPTTIAILVVPFLPAIVLSLMAQKVERQFASLKLFDNAPASTAKAPVKK